MRKRKWRNLPTAKTADFRCLFFLKNQKYTVYFAEIVTKYTVYFSDLLYRLHDILMPEFARLKTDRRIHCLHDESPSECTDHCPDSDRSS